MPELTDDERTVLEIAARGESMMPIGRWEAPVEHLVEIGFLERHDKWNNFITTAGKEALGQEREAVDDAAAKALIARHNAGVEYRRKAEDIAQQIFQLVTVTKEVTGDTPSMALNKILAAIKDRVTDLLDD